MMHQIRWTTVKISQRLELIKPLIYRRQAPLAPFRYTTLSGPMEAPPVTPGVDDSDWPVIPPDSYWGEWRTDYVLRTLFKVPQEWDAGGPVALYLPLGDAGSFVHPEFLAYIDGSAYAACDRYHQEIRLPEHLRDGQAHQLALAGWTGLGDWHRPQPSPNLLMGLCAVVQIDQATRDFVSMARVALGVAASVDPDDPVHGHLLNALDEAFRLLDIREPLDEPFYTSVPQAYAVLRAGIERAGVPLDVDIVATGHAHIDVAWLWTLGQTRRKAGRTFHTVARLMEQFPEYHFTQSQPQLYDFIRQDYPDLFETIKGLVAEERWELTGGMWVESDCNLPGAESLARQFLLGRTFFREHFGPGADSPVLWLPDVFGYSWALPQLIREAGLAYFMTTKIGWNQYNRLPYDSFWWQGIDGTRVLTHFICTPGSGGRWVSTYNGAATPRDVIGTWRTFQQKELQHTLLTAFGYGDGGGGPTREMLENIREMERFPGTPRVRNGSALEFFRQMETEAGEHLPTWNGELYLELHRGTYTSQARSKRANRKSEFLLHDAEFAATLAVLLDDAYTYPAGKLRRAWKLLCLNQFHDIIPGSSITPVYAESLEQYEELSGIGVEVRDAALRVVAGQIDGDLLVVNPSGFVRQEPAFWPEHLRPGQRLQRADGTPVPAQATAQGTWIDAGLLAPLSVTPLFLAEGPAPVPDTGLSATPELLENAALRVEFDRNGDITRIYDKGQRREVLPQGAIANQFQAFEDRPQDWDAWELDIFYDDKRWTAEPATSISVVEAGPLRATLEIRRRILNSDTVQRISLNCHSARLDFDTRIDWRERHVLLKVAFPVDVLSPVATYEIQWGNVERPTHRNTSWDWARFETVAQKWVDLSEGGYGVSLLNDCKYGHDIRDNVMRISLLRSPTLPDPEADRGEQHFVYSLLPHAGRWDETTVGAAYALNDPLLVVRGERGGKPGGDALLAFDRANLVVETVKGAEDGDGLIVRCYESQRRRGPVILRTSFDLAAVWRTNLLEENQSELERLGDQQVRLHVKPYEIITLRLVPA